MLFCINNFALVSTFLLMLSLSSVLQVESGGLGDDDKLLTTVDISNPHVVSEVLITTAVSCYVTPKDITGDVITVACPGGCDHVSDKLWGTVVYYEKSYICAAAIHDGRIPAKEGGRVTFRKLIDESSYVGSTAANITSKSSGVSNSSFVFMSAFEGRQPLYAVSCLAKAEFSDEKEYLIICPGGCDIVSGGIWGTGVYTRDSYVCTAAIHAGKIDAFKGGRAIVRKGPGIQTYHESTQNGITSEGHGPTASSVLIEECPQMLSSVISVDCSFQASHIVGDVFSVKCPPGCTDSFSRVIGSGPYSVASTVCGAAIHNGIIQGTLGGSFTVRKITSMPSFSTVRRNGITSQESDSPFRAFIVQGSIRTYPSLMHVSCETPATHILEDAFTVICPSGCIDQASVWGTTLYTASSSICISAVHSGHISSEHGGSVIVRKIPRQNGFVGSTQNGAVSQDLMGDSVEAFALGGNLEEVKTALTVSCDFTTPSVIDLDFTVRCPDACAERYNDEVKVNWRKGVFNMGEAICLTGNVAGKTITVRRVPGNLVYRGSFEDYLLYTNPHVIDRSHYGKFVVFVDDFDHPSVLSVSWAIAADRIHTDSYTAVCSPRRNFTTPNVFGSGVYTDNSHVCMAGLHDGRINDDGGAVTVRKISGLTSYIGSENHGYTSESREYPWDTSMVFQNSFYHIATTFTVACDTRGYMIEDERYGVICPSGCRDNAVVYGDAVYTDHSYVCAAAIHVGRITEHGGRMLVVRLDGLSSYKGVTMNGVTSLSHGETDIAFGFE